MKKAFLSVFVLLILLVCVWTVKHIAERAVERTLALRVQQEISAPLQIRETVPQTTATPETMTIPETESVPATEAAETTAATEAGPVYTFTEEEEQLLLKLAMAERGNTGCTTCVALVMRTVLNRVESPRFSSTVKGVIYAQDQFTPVMDGSFDEAVPGWRCKEALEMIKEGWDESQGALYYEWCDGESWHSRNLNLLLQHCDTRFYN